MRPYQQDGIDHLYNHDAALLLLRMGGGKTVIAGAAIGELYRDGHITSCLVVAPKAVALNTWQHEFQHWAELAHLEVSVALGTAAQRAAALQRSADIHVISYDNLQWLAHTHPPEEFAWDLIVMDEITRFNKGGKRWRAFQGHLDAAKIRWGLTGSFVANSLADAYFPVKAVDRGAALGRTVSGFYRRYFWSSGYGLEPYAGAEKEIAGRIKHLVLQPDPAVYQSQLPEVVYIEHPYELDGIALKEYRSLQKDGVAMFPEGVIDVAHAGVLGNKLQQICSGFAYHESTAINIDKARMEVLRALIDESAEPVLVWYWFNETGDRLRKEFGALPLLDCLPAWNAGSVPVAICHPRSGGHGINAQAGGATMVWYEHTWSAEERAQAEARLHRQGQTRTVFVHDIMAQVEGLPSIDHMMAEKRAGKITMADAVAKSLGA